MHLRYLNCQNTFAPSSPRIHSGGNFKSKNFTFLNSQETSHESKKNQISFTSSVAFSKAIWGCATFWKGSSLKRTSNRVMTTNNMAAMWRVSIKETVILWSRRSWTWRTLPMPVWAFSTSASIRIGVIQPASTVPKRPSQRVPGRTSTPTWETSSLSPLSSMSITFSKYFCPPLPLSYYLIWSSHVLRVTNRSFPSFI